ncbi:MAG: Acyl-[acyl-carrier-protein]--UDP-N-acetylglucosamine O-acyltransferase [Thermodesulfobacterium sp. 37_54]|uniref:acyl-ACP--UDP-N-acetylglucosamine O-acyltransferase n=1 Tax=Thermodesulfobacterium TaxID=1740 RepID=UPI0003B2EB33|nr:acyl-ACP--UDP-N-acetylglucosamine O-acyltransferase [Thermodesulfobacterium thermophilum]KUJ97773.1 MAG: Acyl-[acyl-carrier-protein]--UDP-N-acetylglucosamine O-acyltransferase [Thermodesulfobacterium sp. 37_54]KUK19400.1 MAG: Acyl-[acyl-carrier-protein]--UDP-N-acetylglucosamine O-acyltransferase [Thermodesulfobacterium commune]HBT03843.1 acyl-ACP--UDP-N-acetylglucosamine O-acyltransferase [Thermodesulfobacterium commune]HCE80564.1 acyl-ACP--UDP-N-acetylglucosamine O-acyltransferase [Thermode
MAKIHPTAYIDPSSEIEEGVEIGPNVYIGPKVFIGKGTIIKPYSYIEKNTKIGENNIIGPSAVIGTDPQHLGYKGEETFVEIGNGNIIREFVTIHRGTPYDDGITRIGNHCLLMAYVHIAHDCKVGDHVVMANAATLGGHVRVGDRVVMGGFSAVHQFCRIGAYAFVSAMTGIDKDVPPYVKVFGVPGKIQGINLVGLRRAGFTKEDIRKISQAVGFFLDAPATIKEVVQELREIFNEDPVVNELVKFLENPSRQGIMRRKPFEGEEAF